jgi:hypothetical protein
MIPTIGRSYHRSLCDFTKHRPDVPFQRNFRVSWGAHRRDSLRYRDDSGISSLHGRSGFLRPFVVTDRLSYAVETSPATCRRRLAIAPLSQF